MENNRKITESDLKLLRKLSTETGGFSDPKSLYDRLKKQNDRPSKELLKILDPSTCHRKYIWCFFDVRVSSNSSILYDLLIVVYLWRGIFRNNKEIDVKKEEEGEHRDERQVALDINRSFIFRIKLRSNYAKTPKIDYLNKLMAGCEEGDSSDSSHEEEEDLKLLEETIQRFTIQRIRDSMTSDLTPIMGYLRLSWILTLTSHDINDLELVSRIFDFLVCYPPIMIVYLTCVLCLTKSIQIDNLLKESKKEGSEIDLDVVHLIMASLPVLKMDHNQSEEQEAVSIEDIITSTINLYTKYPPTDPKLKLNKIMGPKELYIHMELSKLRRHSSPSYLRSSHP
ncbi:hypothetical protein PSTT_02437 [Puccinia striiformis]|uniref:Rab-GAP TBC domain-containing protein n=1 Tax=Puccinia striiformis TaxID=27350 RepID=A0A2S4W040_9BASI|nr:hypothetical protein PSTT_02437 [Puccinia striiformis]